MILEVSIAELRVSVGEYDLDVLEQSRSGRLDIFVQDVDGNQYDVEVQSNPGKDERLRARYYQALMDITYLRKGHKVSELRESVVIFICDFDPIGAGEKRYDYIMRCEQTKKPMNDRRRVVLLNDRGTKGEVSVELDAFLRFAAGEEVDGDEFVDDIKEDIEKLVQNPAWKEAYMTFEEEVEAAARAAAKEAAAKERERMAEERERMAGEIERLLADGTLTEDQARRLLELNAGTSPDERQ